MVLNVPSSHRLLLGSSNVIPDTGNFSSVNCSLEWFLCVMLSEALSGPLVDLASHQLHNC